MRNKILTAILLIATSTLLYGCGKIDSNELIPNTVNADIGAKVTPETKNISLDDFLDKTRTTSDAWDFVALNQNGDVTYKGMIVTTSRGLPLNNENAYTTIEIKVFLSASGAKPRQDCDPSDPANGSLGCYITNPDDIRAKNNVFDFQTANDKKAQDILFKYLSSDEILKSYFLKDYPAFNKKSVLAFRYDLNSDGDDEIIGFSTSEYFCPRSGCLFFVLEKNGNNYKELSNLLGIRLGAKIEILENKSDGYCDYKIYFPDGEIRLFKFKKEYGRYDMQ